MLGRVLLRCNQILVLDEATTNIDFVIDALLQKSICKELLYVSYDLLLGSSLRVQVKSFEMHVVVNNVEVKQ